MPNSISFLTDPPTPADPPSGAIAGRGCAFDGGIDATQSQRRNPLPLETFGGRGGKFYAWWVARSGRPDWVRNPAVACPNAVRAVQSPPSARVLQLLGELSGPIGSVPRPRRTGTGPARRWGGSICHGHLDFPDFATRHPPLPVRLASPALDAAPCSTAG